MKESTPQTIKLGIFVIVGTAVFVLAIYFIGNKQNLFGNTVQINAVFNNVNGLQPGNNVRYSGIDVGTVRSITMINDTAIKVNMALQRNIISYMHSNAIATINSDGLVGSMVVNIIPGEGTSKKVTPGNYIKSYNRVRTEDMLKTLTVTNENAALLTEDLLKITHQINNGKGSIGVLLKDEQVAMMLRETIINLKNGSRETTAILLKVNSLLSDLERKNTTIGVLRDSTVAAQIRHTVLTVNEASSMLKNTIQQIDSMAYLYRNSKSALNYFATESVGRNKIDSVLTHLINAGKILEDDLKAVQSSFLLRGYFKKKEKEQTKRKK